jgi:hypothetical protein
MSRFITRIYELVHLRKSVGEQVGELLQVDKLLNVYRVILPGSARLLMVRRVRMEQMERSKVTITQNPALNTTFLSLKGSKLKNVV